MGGFVFPLYKGDNDATGDDAKDAQGRHPIGKRISQRHPDEDGINDIGITKDRYDTCFIGAIRLGHEILTE